jgi:hypothetical protein
MVTGGNLGMRYAFYVDGSASTKNLSVVERPE